MDSWGSNKSPPGVHIPHRISWVYIWSSPDSSFLLMCTVGDSKSHKGPKHSPQFFVGSCVGVWVGVDDTGLCLSWNGSWKHSCLEADNQGTEMSLNPIVSSMWGQNPQVTSGNLCHHWEKY